MTDWLLRRASVSPGVIRDVAVSSGRIVDEMSAAAHVIDLEGRPTLPGLADHHLHLLAAAAAMRSVDCSPGALDAGGGLAAALRTARARQPAGWLRGVGYDIRANGPLDRARLDAIGVGPLRIQDRTGAVWMLDSLAVAEVLPRVEGSWPQGVELDAAGRATGVLRRLDPWLRSRLPRELPDLAHLGRRLAERGVTAVTDATATNGATELALFASSGLPQRITAMTADPERVAVDGVTQGAVKIVLDEADLPPFAELAARVDAAHAARRHVAVHCVDAVSLTLAISSGLGPGDRIEHASLVPDEHLELLARREVTAVVQPGLIATRGDSYLAETDPGEHHHLYRIASLLRAGVPVLGSSDAPYGPLDPWTAVAAAVSRRTASGAQLGSDEAVDAMTALRLFHTEPPGMPARELSPGAPADIVVLDDDWDTVANHPRVALTMIGGEPAHFPPGLAA